MPLPWKCPGPCWMGIRGRCSCSWPLESAFQLKLLHDSVKWTLFCPLERVLGVLMESFGWETAGPGYVPGKRCVLEPASPGLCCRWLHPKWCSATDVRQNEQGGGCRDLFFPVATKKQDTMGGKQWTLVDVGEKTAEGWVKAVVKLVLIQPLFHMEH